MPQVNTRFALMLAGTDGIGPAKYKNLIGHFHDFDSLKANVNDDIFKECGLSAGAANKIRDFANWDKIDKILEQAEKHQAQIICLGQDSYPEFLANIYSPPPIIYVKGKRELLNKPAVAVVGSRTPTAYGRMMANKIASELAGHGLLIVSGLAWGIDAEAHKAALATGGMTGAVFGCGLDIIYPSDHKELADNILAGGFWISEFAFGTVPERHNFPRRNRIISGLSLAVVVVEAAAKSGALVTANLAVEQGKDVFAVPGPADSPKSNGTINLIKQGAFVATSAADILENLGWQTDKKSALAEAASEALRINLEPDEQKVCDLISRGPVHIDEITRNLGFSTSQLSAILLKLELSGLIVRRPGNFLART